MHIHSLHEWPQTLDEAIVLQQQLRSQVMIADQLPDPLSFVAGVDVGLENGGSQARAAVVVLTWPDLQLHEYALARRPCTFAYVPGFLSFREVPVVLDALQQLTTDPDVILCDGQGYAHPRRFGIACHLGLWTGLPTIGVGKSRLLGHHDPVPTEKGSWRPLIDQGEQIGVVLRSRTNTNPLYVSVGHRVTLPTALQVVMGCLTRYRIPETTRWADRLAAGDPPSAIRRNSPPAVTPQLGLFGPP